MLKWTTLAAILLLTACQTPPASQVASFEVALTTADTAALAYTTLPACNGSTPLCSDPATKAKIKTAAAAAYAAVKLAEATVRNGGTPDLASVAAAITALQNLIPKGTS